MTEYLGYNISELIEIIKFWSLLKNHPDIDKLLAEAELGVVKKQEQECKHKREYLEKKLQM